MKKTLLVALSFCCLLSANIPLDIVKNIETHARTSGWGNLYYDVLSKVIQEQRYRTVVEVGVALGGHAEHILRTTSVTDYFGVDPYQCYDGNDSFQQDISGYSSLPLQENFDYLCQWVADVRLKPFESRCHLIRKPAAEAASSFSDESVDCIFIDGDHRYEGVLKDLAAWFPKLKKGHLILGDDYWMAPVAAAVHNFFTAEGKREVFFFTSESGYRIWAVRK